MPGQSLRVLGGVYVCVCVCVCVCFFRRVTKLSRRKKAGKSIASPSTLLLITFFDLCPSSNVPLSHTFPLFPPSFVLNSQFGVDRKTLCECVYMCVSCGRVALHADRVKTRRSFTLSRFVWCLNFPTPWLVHHQQDERRFVY
jgi:hypothetical protein